MKITKTQLFIIFFAVFAANDLDSVNLRACVDKGADLAFGHPPLVRRSPVTRL